MPLFLGGSVVPKLKCFKFSLVCLFFIFIGCNSSAVKDAIDLIDGIPRKDIDTSRLGVNAFASDARFGSSAQQLQEVKNVLRLNKIRILFAWTSAVQASKNSAPDFSFYDEIVNSIPDGVDALVVLASLPSWMANSANWIEGNPRTTFVDLWVKKVAQRYKNNPKIIGYEIWNEPNMVANPENITLGIATEPANYIEMLARANNAIESIDRSKLVVAAATTSIVQNYPETLEYNRAMRDAGLQNFADIVAVHYYGKQYENFIKEGGVEDYLNGLSKPIWVTESGEQGVEEQLGYGEEVWPLLLDRVPGVERIYQYQFTDATPSANSYGMKTLDAVSDLYIFLRDRE